MLWDAGFDGSMEQGYEAGFTHPWNDFDDSRYRGLSFVYPTMNGFVGTLQWEGHREGIDDVRYMTTLEQAIAGAPPQKAALARQAQAWLDGLDFDNDPRGHKAPLTYLDDDVVQEWMENLYPETADLDRVRERIINWILKLQS